MENPHTPLDTSKIAAATAGMIADLDGLKKYNRNLVDEFRANGGKVSGLFGGLPVLLITATGAKSGNSHTRPLVYSEDRGRLVIAASAAGAPFHPPWYWNLKVHPKVIVEIGRESFSAIAIEAEGPERDRLYRQHANLMPVFDEYAVKTAGVRQIPVFTLERE